MARQPRILAVIPARGGSKGIPGKNLRLVGGRSLVARSILCAIESGVCADIVCSTDDPAISAESQRAGARVIDRPPLLAADETPTWPVIWHALSVSGPENYDAVFTLQPTNPLREASDLRLAVRLLAGGWSSVLSVVEVRDWLPERMCRLAADGGITWEAKDPVQIWAPRQVLPARYLRDGSIYLTTTDSILRSDLCGRQPRWLLIPESRSLRIDTEDDLELAEYRLTRQRMVWNTT